MHPKFQGSRFIYLLATTTIASFISVATTTAVAEELQKPMVVATSGKMNWGIRESFNNYTGGASKVEDGAQRISTNNFEFNLEKATYDAAKERTEAQFRGKIVYLKYCDDSKNFTNCKLDLTIKDPKIVISNEDSYIDAEVASKQYPTGNWYKPEQRVKIANLYPGSATIKSEDNRTEWTNIVSALANPGGVQMFSEFYGENEGLAPLSFSYDGFGEKPSLLKGGYIQSGKEWKSPQGYTDGYHKLVDLGDAILVAVGKKGLYLLDNNLEQLQEVAVPKLGQVKVGTYDPDSRIYYYVESTNQKDLIAVPVSTTKIGTPYKVASATDPIQNIAYHPKTKKLVAITESSSSSYVPVKDRKAKLGILTHNSFQYKDLPPAQELFPEELKESMTGTTTPYAMLYEFYNDVPEFIPMEDGTFILNSSSDLHSELGGTKQTIKNTILSIKAEAAGTTEDPVVKVMQGSRSNDPKLANAVNIHSDGSLVVRFDQNPHKDYAFGQVLRYHDRELSDISGIIGTDKTGFSGWSNVAFDPSGKIVVESGEEGKLSWYDPEKKDWLKERELRLPRGRQTEELAHGTFIARKDGTLIVPNYDKTDESNEVYSLIKLVDSSRPPAVVKTGNEINAENIEKNKHGLFGSWSSTIATLAGVVGAIISVLGIGSLLVNFFNIRIPGIR